MTMTEAPTRSLETRPSRPSAVMRAIAAADARALQAPTRARLVHVLTAHLRHGARALSGARLAIPDSEIEIDACVFESDEPPRERFDGALVFRIVLEHELGAERARAHLLVHRGARRVFFVVSGMRSLVEWSPVKLSFVRVERLDDPALVRPVEVLALFDDATAREAVARAIVERRDWPVPLLCEEVVIAERRAALFRILAARQIRPTRQQRARIYACVDPKRLQDWMAGAPVTDPLEDL